MIRKPAEAAREPDGPTNTTTGVFAARIAVLMSRVESDKYFDGVVTDGGYSYGLGAYISHARRHRQQPRRRQRARNPHRITPGSERYQLSAFS